MTNEHASLIKRRSVFSATAQQQCPPGVGKSRIEPGECGRQTRFVEISYNDAN
jgi:hypothetical protein